MTPCWLTIRPTLRELPLSVSFKPPAPIALVLGDSLTPRQVPSLRWPREPPLRFCDPVTVYGAVLPGVARATRSMAGVHTQAPAT